MRGVVLLDTGPLVAWLCDSDQWHEWSAEQFAKLEPVFVTCEAVLTEACFLYARAGGDPAKIIATVRRGLLDVTFTLASEAASTELLLQRYADTPISLADACLVRLSEVHKDCRVLTLD